MSYKKGDKVIILYTTVFQYKWVGQTARIVKKVEIIPFLNQFKFWVEVSSGHRTPLRLNEFKKEDELTSQDWKNIAAYRLTKDLEYLKEYSIVK